MPDKAFPAQTRLSSVPFVSFAPFCGKLESADSDSPFAALTFSFFKADYPARFAGVP